MFNKPAIYPDFRGSFCEIFNGSFNVKQINQAYSTKGVLRGMHYQNPGQTKLVWVPYGKILDVIIELDTGKVSEFILDDKSCSSLTVPHNYAHGYQVLSDSAVVCYAVDQYWNKDGEKHIHWDSFGYRWPMNPLLSDKDFKK